MNRGSPDMQLLYLAEFCIPDGRNAAISVGSREGIVFIACVSYVPSVWLKLRRCFRSGSYVWSGTPFVELLCVPKKIS